MRQLVSVIIVGLLIGSVLAEEGEKMRTFRFSKEDLGKLPAGWKAEKTGTGEGSVWKIVADATAPSKTGHVLAQTAKAPKPLFNICVSDTPSFGNGEISVSFKAIEGDVDQGGGLIWRYQDANNYYIARMNPLEKNYRLYKVVDGKRVQLGTKEGLDIPDQEWHTLKIEHQGDRIACFLDGKKELEATDATFKSAGKIGLWTKADAQTYFDDLKVSSK